MNPQSWWEYNPVTGATGIFLAKTKTLVGKPSKEASVWDAKLMAQKTIENSVDCGWFLGIYHEFWGII